MPKPRQAVIVIHGIGEQRPMETLRGFVLGVIGNGKLGDGRPAFYSKPDPNAEGFEVRRYRAFEGRTDTDFIEFYWQHLMPVAASRFMFSWLWTMMRRPPGEVVARFRFLWWFGWGALALLAAGALVAILAWLLGFDLPLPALPGLAGFAAAAAAAIWYTVRSFVGDAAIYLNPHPRTVEARNAIRAAGVALLERVQTDGRYDRIVVVGHSLGSVIGYDILNFSWHRASEAFRKLVEAGGLPPGGVDQPELKAAEALAGGSGEEIASRWCQAVRTNAAEQRRLGVSWLVTDFVTLGSPLAHGSLLLARGRRDLRRRQQERELPTCPPYREDGKHFSYERRGNAADGTTRVGRVVDHGAVFAMTCWTNLYFPARYLLVGDAVGGPLAPVMGRGVRDLAVSTPIRGGWLAHARYWTPAGSRKTAADFCLPRLIGALDLQRGSFRKRKSPATPASPAPNPPVQPPT